MTTIVYKNSVVATDSMLCNRNNFYETETEKGWKLQPGVYVFFAGTHPSAARAAFEEVYELYLKDRSECRKKCLSMNETLYDGTFLYVDFKNKQLKVASNDLIFRDLPWDRPYGIGSGSHFALGALAYVDEPRWAVSVAAQYDPDTGGDIYVYDANGRSIHRADAIV